MFLDNTEYEIKAGQTLIIKAGQLHGGYRNYDEGLEYYWFHFFARESDGGEITLAPHLTPSRPEKLVNLIEEYLIDIYAKRKNQIAKNLMACLILLELSDYSDKTDSDFSPLAAKIHTYIHENIANPLHSSIIAHKFGMSADYIERIYKKTYGETITVAIQKARIFHACSLLRYTTMNISEIASTSGFTRVNDFCRVFKRIKTVTPTEYKKRHIHDIINNI
jgi:AraC-like DNA-binding protein